MLRVYSYKGCDSCRKALKWLEGRDVSFSNIPIRESPPTKSELKRMLGYYEGSLRRLFNVSGGDYRSMGLKDTLPGMSDADAVDLLAGNGNLIKRPFAIGADNGVVGFKPDDWETRLGL